MNLNTTNISPLISEQHSLKLLSTASKVIEICDIIESKGYKLIINQYDRLIITSNTSLIIENLRLSHPIQILLKENLNKVVDNEYMIIFFGKVLQGIRDLILKGMKVRNLVDGLRDLKKNLRISIEEIGEKCDDYELIIRSILKNKKLEELMIEAIRLVGHIENGQRFSDVLEDHIRICKIPAGSLDESYVLSGMVFEHGPESSLKNISNSKTAIFNCPIDINRTETKGTVLFKNAEEMLNFSLDEEKDIEKLIESFNADVLICNGSVGDIHLDFLNKNKKLVFKIPSKHDIRRIRNSLGGVISSTFKPLKEEQMGFVQEVKTIYEGGKIYTNFISQSNVASIILKGSLTPVLDEYERNFEKVIKALKSLKSEFKILRDFENQIITKLKLYVPDPSIKLVYDITLDAFRNINNKNCKCCPPENDNVSICEDRIRAIECAIDMIIDIVLIEDYLVSKPEGITPRENKDFR